MGRKKKENEALWIEIARLIYTFQNGDYKLKEIKTPKQIKALFDCLFKAFIV